MYGRVHSRGKSADFSAEDENSAKKTVPLEDDDSLEKQPIITESKVEGEYTVAEVN